MKRIYFIFTFLLMVPVLSWAQNTKPVQSSDKYDKLLKEIKLLKKELEEVKKDTDRLKSEADNKWEKNGESREKIEQSINKLQSDFSVLSKREVATQDSIDSIKRNWEIIAKNMEDMKDEVGYTNEKITGMETKLKDIEDAVIILRQEQVRQSEEWDGVKDKRKKLDRKKRLL